MTVGRDWTWWSTSKGGRLGIRYIEPLLEVVEVHGSRAEVRVREAQPTEAEPLADEEARGLALGSAPALPKDLRMRIEEARSEHGVRLGRGISRWLESIAAGDEEATMRPLREGSIPPNLLLRDFGVAYMNVLSGWPLENVASLVPELVRLGADPDVLDARGQGSLHAALKRPLVLAATGTTPPDDGVLATVASLVERGARPRRDATGRSPLHFLMGLPVEVTEWAALVRLLVEAGDGLDLIDDERGWTALHVLVDGPRVRLARVQTLLDLGADITARDHEGRTAFDLAQLYQRGSLFAALLAPRSASTSRPLALLEQLVTRERAGWSPPHRYPSDAIEARDLAALQMLLDDGADPDGRDLVTASPLRLARARGLAEFESALLAAGASRDEGAQGIQFGPEIEAQFAATREKLARAVAHLVPPERALAADTLAADEEAARAVRADPALASQIVGGRALASIASWYGLSGTLETILDVAPASVPTERQRLLESSLSCASLDTFRMLLKRGFDPLDRHEFMSVFQRAALDGRIEALVACCESGASSKLIAREARASLKNLALHGQGRTHYVAAFLRQLLAAINGGVDGISVDVRPRAHNASPDAWGAGAYYQDVNGGKRVPPVVAVNAPFDAVVAARASPGRQVCPGAHHVGVPWVPRAEIVLRLGQSPWALWVPHGPCPEGAAGIAGQLTDDLGVRTLVATLAGPVLRTREGDPVQLRVGEVDAFCAEHRLTIPALESSLDLGIVGLAVRGLVRGAVTDAAVIVVSPDRWRERASPNELAAVDGLRRQATTARSRRRRA